MQNPSSTRKDFSNLNSIGSPIFVRRQNWLLRSFVLNGILNFQGYQVSSSWFGQRDAFLRLFFMHNFTLTSINFDFIIG
jgi:hypothetical protein